MVGNNSAIEKMLQVYTKDYRHNMSMPFYYGFLNPQRPLFSRFYVQLMLRDPHIWYGMELLKGPIISKAKFEVESNDAEVATFVDRQIKTFWSRGIDFALDHLSWGFSAGEVIYDFNEFEGVLEYKDLKFLHQKDVKVYTKDGELAAVLVKKALRDKPEENSMANDVYLLPPKCFWLVNDKKYNRWYGRSRLEGAFDSWWECWMPKGFRSIRHQWFYRHAYEGGVLYYPDGTTQDPETGEQIPNAQIATELLDRKETGSSLALPQKTGDVRDWEYESPKGNQPPEGLFEYGDSLRDEMWEGIGVPPEVAKQEDTGSFAGRRVPQQAFYSYLQQIANDVVYAFDEQVIKPLVKLAFGLVQYTINPIPILQTLQEEEMGKDSESMPGESQQFDEEGNPIEDSGPSKLSNGRIEDRDSNAFNMKEKAFAKKGN